MDAVLSVKDVNVVFSGFKALKGVNLDVYDGEIVTIIGPNGAGKSTLLDAIVGKSPVFSGHVYYHGKDITNHSPYAIARGGIGRKFSLADRQWRTSVQFYGNVAKPEGAPDWALRLALTAVIPL